MHVYVRGRLRESWQKAVKTQRQKAVKVEKRARRRGKQKKAFEYKTIKTGLLKCGRATCVSMMFRSTTEGGGPGNTPSEGEKRRRTQTRRQSKTHELRCEDEKTARSIRRRGGTERAPASAEHRERRTNKRLATPNQRKQKKIIGTQQPSIHTRTHMKTVPAQNYNDRPHRQATSASGQYRKQRARRHNRSADAQETR